MTQEQKELLIKDLCARLPYRIKAYYYGAEEECETWDEIESITLDGYVDIGQYILPIETVKPYLFPLSSMTEEQLYNNPIGFSQMLTIKADRDWENITIDRRSYYKLVDWFNKNHFDYRGLIPMGLAIDATNLNIY